MKNIVIYQTGTGFTQKYAEWIGEALQCEVRSIKELSTIQVKNFDTVIYGGWIMGGMVSGLEELRKTTPNNIVVYGVGFSKRGECEETLIQTNHLENTPFYYMEGGFHPKKMGFFKRFIIKAVTKSPVVETDNTDKAYIDDLVDYVKSLSGK